MRKKAKTRIEKYCETPIKYVQAQSVREIQTKPRLNQNKTSFILIDFKTKITISRSE